MTLVARAAAVGLLLGCSGHGGAPASAPPGGQGVVTPPTSHGTFPPSTSALAVVYPARAALDVEHGHVLIHRERGVDVLELASGQAVSRVDLGWDGEAWPATSYLLAFHTPDVLAIEATLIDPVAARRVATCSRTVKAPAGAQILRVDVFTASGTMYLKWETAPPPGPPRGVAMTADEVTAWKQRFDAAYACGLLSVRVAAGGCSLEPSTFQQAGLESCETRQMPPQRVMPATLGDLRLRVEDGLHPDPQHGGVETEIETLIVQGTNGTERWRTEIGRQLIVPPPP